jgi:hypothetical protein
VRLQGSRSCNTHLHPLQLGRLGPSKCDFTARGGSATSRIRPHTWQHFALVHSTQA